MTTTPDAVTVQATPFPIPSAIEQALVAGDIAGLTMEQRGAYYRQVCESLGLNPLTQPFGYLVLNGTLRLYALKACTDQLRALHKISIEIVSMKTDRDLFVCHVRARDAHGRTDEDIGFAVISTLKGEALGNAQLKALTKSKRRVTLSICGLGMLDESEVTSIPEARTYRVDAAPAPMVGNGHLPPAADAAQHNQGDIITSNTTTSERPSAEQIDALFALAESCGEPKEVFGTTLRRIMGLSDDVRITKRLLRETMTMQLFEMARTHYEQLLRRQVEDDVPDGTPPDAGEVSTLAPVAEAPIPDAEE